MESVTAQQKIICRRVRTILFDSVGALALALAILLVILTHLFRVVGVNGESMNPTLFEDQRLLLSVVSDEYTYGDIIVIDRYTDIPLIKRVVAVGGDIVTIDDGKVFVNGEALNENYTLGKTEPREFVGPQSVPEGYYFVLGDNRVDSEDSRYGVIGMVSEKDVVGKAIFRVWPIPDIGLIY